MQTNHVCGIVLHGGAGAVPEDTLRERNAFLKELAGKYFRALLGGMSALDAVVQALCEIEDSGLFNAGTGSVLNQKGEREMDASLMTSDGESGAVASVSSVRHPIQLARLVMEKTPHLLLCGAGAEEFARKHRLAPSLPIPEHRLREFKALQTRVKEHPNAENKGDMLEGGTVGAIALDIHGKLCAGTSTGGLWLKMKGRVGDTPIIGAGTFATPHSACSATGYGEGILKLGVTRKWCESIESLPIQDATTSVLQQCERAQVPCGLIGITVYGRWIAQYITKNMSWAGQTSCS